MSAPLLHRVCLASWMVCFALTTAGNRMTEAAGAAAAEPSCPQQASAAEKPKRSYSDQHAQRPERYDVVWDSPSRDASGSMPLGSGQIALNAWVEPSGDLVFYIGRTDSWGDNGRLLKVGRVRIALEPCPSTARRFEQRLSLKDATLVVHWGEHDEAVGLRLWVDANHPVVHVVVESQRPTTATASIELWRTARYELTSLEVSDVMLDRSRPDKKHAPTIVEPDTVLTGQTGRIGWYHHNVKSVGPGLTARIQGLGGFARPDPLLGRTFGAVIEADGGRRLDDLRLQSPASKSHRFSIYVHTVQPASPGEWLAAVDKLIDAIEKTPFDARRKKHEAWWAKFWNRSWIHVTENEPLPPPSLIPANDHPVRIGSDQHGQNRLRGQLDDAFVVSRGYALQRFIAACAGRGAYPIKFNGSLFTVPWPGKLGDADYRRWGPGYWWQNTRLPYYSMCASGDFEMIKPLFRMYGRDLMPLFKYRTRLYFGHDGAFIPECIYFWGDVFSETYGWTPFEERGEDKLQTSRWHKWEWVSGLEIVWLMLDYYEHTLDEAFLKNTLLPAAHEVLAFFDQHYQTDENGKLVMHPAQACETWWDCTNPMPELAGLHAVTARLLDLPETLTADDARVFWESLRAKLPDLPTREVDGVKMLAPAERFAVKHNIENPELYAVFPFRLVAFEKPNAKLGIEALRHRWDRGNLGWRQDDIFMANLGLADEARDSLVGRARRHHTGSRFPAFWGPNYDWVPDQDHGSVLMAALQAMLLQTDGRKILLLPAWPKNWNVCFKLHAPSRTVIQCEYRGGAIRTLKVTPSHRRQDIITGGSVHYDRIAPGTREWTRIMP